MQTKKRRNRAKKERQNCKEKQVTKWILSKTRSEHKTTNNNKTTKNKDEK